MCILLVEDEALIRDLLVDELTFQGFEVHGAEAGDQAAALIETPPTPFSLLITDIHMPGRLSGIDVARLLRQRHPLIPIIYMTGRHDALNALLPCLQPQEAVLPKPFSLSALLVLIRRLLGPRASPRPGDAVPHA
jgi:DNA-binding response OmpR family regulator